MVLTTVEFMLDRLAQEILSMVDIYPLMRSYKMNITLAQYIKFKNKDESIKATIDGTEMFVPLASANRHYAEILKQVKEGTLTIKDAD